MTQDSHRFSDANKRLEDFETEVVIECPKCEKKAHTTVNYDLKEARLFCSHCGFNKTTDTQLSYFGIKAHYKTAACTYFNASMWYFLPFKDEFIWAYNEAHLEYLEKYIAAKLRESNNRSHFTLLEKLPKFYHDAKNREALLKAIAKLKAKK